MGLGACQDHLPQERESTSERPASVRLALGPTVDPLPPSWTALREKDLAPAFSLNSKALVRGSTPLGDGDVLLPAPWLASVSSAFRSTNVGQALDHENRYEDWHIVSARIAPCAPLGTTPSQSIDVYCWPEVRLVFQPIVHNAYFHERFAPRFADDRALHALYDAPALSALSPEDTRIADSLRAKIRAYAESWSRGPFVPLSDSELATWERLRDAVIARVLGDTLALRSPAFPPQAYEGLGVRPESDGTPAEQEALRQRMVQWLSRNARPAQLKQLTSFSLPEGREPAAADEWVFLSFQGDRGQLHREDLRVRSAKDGRVLFSFGGVEAGSMASADPAILPALDGSTTGQELRESVVAVRTDVSRLLPILRDRTQRLVANTTCASCHQLNPIAFDLHNFSYLEDRELTISPRVVTDVALDQRWLSARRSRP